MAITDMFSDRNKLHGMVLGVLGIILLIVGYAITVVHNPLRGSGAGTALIVLGIIMTLIGLWRFTKKAQ